MQQTLEHLHVEMRQSQAIQEETANRARIPAPNIKKGTYVWLNAWHIRSNRPTQKLEWKWLGPFKLLCRISPYAYKLERPTAMWMNWVGPISLWYLIVDDPLDGHQIEPPPPVEVNGEEKYQVTGVEDSRMYRNLLQYLIWWTGCDFLTWEPAKFVDGLQTVEEFHQRYAQKAWPLENVLGRSWT
jgi:hypothetical protein